MVYEGFKNCVFLLNLIVIVRRPSVDGRIYASHRQVRTEERADDAGGVRRGAARVRQGRRWTG